MDDVDEIIESAIDPYVLENVARLDNCWQVLVSDLGEIYRTTGDTIRECLVNVSEGRLTLVGREFGAIAPPEPPLTLESLGFPKPKIPTIRRRI